MKRVILSKEAVLAAIEATDSLSQASVVAGVSYQTFLRRASEYHLTELGKNVGLKGTNKPWAEHRKLKLDDILNNVSFEVSAKLKQRLFKAGLKKNVCEECSISEWNGKPIVCHLDHVNGDNKDNRLENLKILCPNCHSQTPTYCRGQGKNKK